MDPLLDGRVIGRIGRFNGVQYRSTSRESVAGLFVQDLNGVVVLCYLFASWRGLW